MLKTSFVSKIITRIKLKISFDSILHIKTDKSIQKANAQIFNPVFLTKLSDMFFTHMPQAIRLYKIVTNVILALGVKMARTKNRIETELTGRTVFINSSSILWGETMVFLV